MENKLYLEADIEIKKETVKLREIASDVIKLPEGSEKQPDLLYMSAILVSTGENLNHAYFMGSELVAAEGTIANKALDVEHIEDEIIGHMYDRAFIDKEGNALNFSELASTETASLDKKDMHVVMAGVIYKERFPQIAEEVASGNWKVSMECYFQNYDVKIGDLIMDRNDAEVMGLASIDKSIGKKAKVMKAGKCIASGPVTRVLRNICFSGCGIVKNPANPPSVILETASDKPKEKSDDIIVLNYELLDNNNVTLDKVEAAKKSDDIDGSAKKDSISSNNIKEIAKKIIKEIFSERAKSDRRVELLEGLKAALREAVKTQSR